MAPIVDFHFSNLEFSTGDSRNKSGARLCHLWNLQAGQRIAIANPSFSLQSRYEFLCRDIGVFAIDADTVREEPRDRRFMYSEEDAKSQPTMAEEIAETDFVFKAHVFKGNRPVEIRKFGMKPEDPFRSLEEKLRTILTNFGEARYKLLYKG